ncbi:transcriptional regulator, DeoR family [Streptoalloteichus tenebrarius]|uniref:Transcriptional regulator, DeoR family n=1 Tax=Streptoalloteichus tenebrarius (strain ATCC 17920 / DSM 40477 / JCM 4838 / CBS 697.72 / NBRC 16177 / NCIMB 11028 / NRRL B-12390 / A12253. 1 / ISP 5477) TaxID=1933 RepID=A0ABT1I3L3_STRSD|nr:DeoR/GlpR family DNA-binding transcription regulator [Streptoalloteichus tenebrarius]MCP2262329.1 transcriptional regulator, DeoR family [Streptoalloteichus tenebrarius]BFF02223.1 DeoR/GlpR family DNA-binding transcription regulator [Streptoalloteichus tenebrarius]
MNRYERLNALLEILAERGRIEVDEIAAELDVSAATIRRDLDHLADQQLLTRTRGGAVAHAVSYDLPLRYKSVRHADEKQRIGRAAAALASRGSVVGLNGGTTATEVARAMATRADLHHAESETALTVVTNALNIANELAVRPQVKLVVTGGVARPQSYELIGPLGTRILEELTLDITFLGVDAVDPVAGASAHHEGEASINRLLAARARKVVVVADSSKLGARAFARICGVEGIHVLVTDRDATDEDVRRFEERGVEVLRV